MASEEVMITPGGRQCSGSIQISGAKNAALPLMAASLLTNQVVTLQNVPQITDVNIMKQQLQSYGVQVAANGPTLQLQATSANARSAPSGNKGSTTRGSFLVLGALLGRFKAATVYYPGGCNIGKSGRPVNFHIGGLEQMGAKIEYRGDHIVLNAPQGLHGAQIHFPKISVGATENILMAACLANGRTVITNAAVEPEVRDLFKMLNEMGMAGNIKVFKDNNNFNNIVVNGRGGYLLGGCTHTVIPDRIEAGTYAIAAAMTGGSLTLVMDPTIGEEMTTVLQCLKQAGVTVTKVQNGLNIQRSGPIQPVSITTGPYPQFPTDLLPQWVTFMTQAVGPSEINDTIYDSRFNHVEYLKKMGASFTKYSDTEYRVHGNASLTGKQVRATDLRAGAALILAALVAGGTTVVKEFQHVRRGYEDIKEKLQRGWGNIFQQLPQTRSGFHGGQ